MSAPQGASPDGARDETRVGAPSVRSGRARAQILVKMCLVAIGFGVLLVWAHGALPADRPAVSPAALTLAIVLNQVGLLAAALRLRATLAAFGIRVTRLQAQSIHLRSLFYFFFVPMSVGMEIGRFVAIRRIDSGASTKRILVAVLVDRVLGLIAALAALAALAGPVLPAGTWARIDLAWCLAAAALAGVLGVGTLAHRRLRQRALALWAALRPIWPRLLWPTALSLVTLALVCAAVFAFAAGSGLGVGWATVAFALSLSLLGMAIPASLLGATFGEAVGIGTLALIGVSPGASVLLVSAAYGGRLIGAIQGAAIELWGDAGRVARGG